MLTFKVGLKDKLTLLIAGITFTIIALFSCTYYLQSKDALIQSLRTDLKDTAMCLALLIDAKEIESILTSTESSEAYWNLKRKLNRFTLLGDQKISAAYVMASTRRKAVLEVVADNELKNPEMMARLKEKYDISKSPEMMQAFWGPTADNDFTEDQWGHWLSGYAPIYNTENRPVAILGIDMKAADVEKLKGEILDVTLLYLLLGAIVSLGLGRFAAFTITRPITALRKGVKDIEDRKYGTRINIKRNDEIGELINTFNQMSAKLSEVDKIKSDFLSIISHELYTPLTPIRVGAEQLKNSTELSPILKQVAVIIERQVQKMQNLVDEILDFSWLTIEDWKLNKEPISINSLLEETFGQFQTAMDRKEIQLKTELPSESLTIMADKKRLLHVLKIIMDNAIRFTPEKGNILVKTYKSDGQINVIFEDTGIGLAPENLNKIFESFYQVEDHLTRTKGGLGIGLAIAKRIVEAHGGKIFAESAGLGNGSRFIFFLPIV